MKKTPSNIETIGTLVRKMFHFLVVFFRLVIVLPNSNSIPRVQNLKEIHWSLNLSNSIFFLSVANRQTFFSFLISLFITASSAGLSNSLGPKPILIWSFGYKHMNVTSHFVITVALCNNSPSHFVIPDTFCNKSLLHFSTPDALCNTWQTLY